MEEAESGGEAIALCRRDPPELILSDWMMPGMSGPEFCRAVRDLGCENYVYFILLTSKSGTEQIALGLDAGADDFLTKPVNSAELRARMAAGMRILDMEHELLAKNYLVRSTLEELLALYDSLDSDLLEAKKLQQSLLSERYRDLGPAKVSLMLHSSGHVGGDLVGMFPICDTHVGLYGLDVSGHGISSALMTARLAGYLSAAVPGHNIALHEIAPGRYAARPPAETVSRLNDVFLADLETGHYFTIALADVDLATGHVILAQAGHPHPAVHRADGSVEFVGQGGLPVGLIEGADYEQVEFRLTSGDRLFIYSDGITECAAPDGCMLDESGLATMMRHLHRTQGPVFLESLTWKLSDYVGGARFSDDISAAMLEFRPKALTG